MTARWKCAGVVLALGLGLAGCGGDEAADDDLPHFEALDPSWDLSLAGPSQRDAMSDGKVVEAEYRDGFDRFEACLADEGYELASVRTVGGVIDFGIPADAVESGAEAECYQTHFAFVDVIWQYEHNAERDYVDRVNECLELDGVRSPQATTSAEAEQALSDAGRTLADCP